MLVAKLLPCVLILVTEASLSTAPKAERSDLDPGFKDATKRALIQATDVEKEDERELAQDEKDVVKRGWRRWRRYAVGAAVLGKREAVDVETEEEREVSQDGKVVVKRGWRRFRRRISRALRRIKEKIRDDVREYLKKKLGMALVGSVGRRDESLQDRDLLQSDI